MTLREVSESSTLISLVLRRVLTLVLNVGMDECTGSMWMLQSSQLTCLPRISIAGKWDGQDSELPALL